MKAKAAWTSTSAQTDHTSVTPTRSVLTLLEATIAIVFPVSKETVMSAVHSVIQWTSLMSTQKPLTLLATIPIQAQQNRKIRIFHPTTSIVMVAQRQRIANKIYAYVIRDTMETVMNATLYAKWTLCG